MLTPVRRQYLKIRQRYPEAVILFRLGDFYESFDEDAEIVSKELEITLTSREMGKGQRYPMAGIPYHALDSYLGKLINRGYKVAICEQLSKPGSKPGIVDRDVVRVVTPGTVVEPSLLQGNNNNYLVSIFVEGNTGGISYVDITTGDFYTSQMLTDRLFLEVERLQPAELLLSQKIEGIEKKATATLTRLEEYQFDLEESHNILLNHFKVATLEGFGCENLSLSIRTAGAIISYLIKTQASAIGNINSLTTYFTDNYMTMDAQTWRNLEIFQSSSIATRESSLISILDITKTSMGGRLLRKWLSQPLISPQEINVRLNKVEFFKSNSMARQKTISILNRVSDIERFINRINSIVATPKEVVALKHSLQLLPALIESLTDSSGIMNTITSSMSTCPDVVNLIESSIIENPPAALDSGGLIKEGFTQELDDLKKSSSHARLYLANLEKVERERTGIKSLKVGYNRVFGYYIEVTKAHIEYVPKEYIRKQTLSNAERYYTTELKEYESIILNAQEKIVELEAEIFRQVCHQIAQYYRDIIQTARAIAEVDVYSALAELAHRYNYTRPIINQEDRISVKKGRHPVVERFVQDEPFIPNDTYLSNQDNQIIILTGPNMSGKSTYLRQVALIVLLAQVGSFVPAESANIGVVDRIFTRIGAQDDLATGRSTFMVEMIETANILNNATKRSLIVLDEIGRGTSTYDGLSIARAVVEYIHNHPRISAKTLFATHYHELTDLAKYFPRVKNYNFAVTEEGDKVIFLRRIVPGGADKSYGIHVAQIAGIPKTVINRAREVLKELESIRGTEKEKRVASKDEKQMKHEQFQQLSLFNDRESKKLLEEITKLDINVLTPIEAITRLYEIQKKIRELY